MSKIRSRDAAERRPADRRASRTRYALGQALMTLAPRHGFDALEVRALAAQAGIGRSTFYRHFADKDDFLIHSFADMVAAYDAHARAHRPGYAEALPAREVFAHVAEVREFALSLAASGQVARTHAAREDKLRAIAEANLKRLRPGLTLARRRELAVMLAGAFATLVRWWTESGLTKDAAHVAGLYETLAKRLLAGEAASAG